MPETAILRPAIEKTPESLSAGRKNRDRPLYAPFIPKNNLLIISYLCFSFVAVFSKAQKTNELCFDDLVVNFVAGHPREFREVKGFLTPGLSDRLKPAPEADFILNIAEPQVTYENLTGPYFAREIEANLNYRDSTDHEYAVTWRDTLHRKQVKAARNTKLKILRGADPRFHAKFLLPGLLIGTGIAGIISLFYIRSS